MCSCRPFSLGVANLVHFLALLCTDTPPLDDEDDLQSLALAGHDPMRKFIVHNYRLSIACFVEAIERFYCFPATLFGA